MMTLAEAVDETIRRLSEVPGTSTQVYSEERVVRLLNSAFKFIRSDCDWPELMQWYTRTLDGTTGKMTARIPNTVGPKDIKGILPVNSDIKLAALPTTINPNNLVGNGQPRWVQLLGAVDDPFVNGEKFLFRLWPFNSTGDFNILVKHNKVWKSSHDLETELWLDDEAMILHVCMREVSSDGANQAEQADFAEQFKDRMKQIRRDNLNLPSDLNPGSMTTPYSWYDPSVYFA